MNYRIKHVNRLCGELIVPGDKSISHRALMLASLAETSTEIHGLSPCADVNSTRQCLNSLGVKITIDGDTFTVHGNGLHSYVEPQQVLDAGNSGTTIRLLSGILAGQPFVSTLTGDESLKKRPMKRIIEPLQQMGARINGVENGFAPLTIMGGSLKGIAYQLPVASAQVKSCVLLAGLFADGKTTVIEPAKSRDHTERLLKFIGATLEIEGHQISVNGRPHLRSHTLIVPGDLSSAAFFIAAASVIKNSDITIKNVGINPTRTGILDVLQQMGCVFKFQNNRHVNNEPCADIRIRPAALKGIKIGGEFIPRVIDEIPILAVIATQAQGQTIIRDAAELRIKETDRLAAVCTNLQKMGARVTELPDGLVIEGEQTLGGAEIDTFDDHRIAMAFAIAGLLAQGETHISHAECVNISYPNFFEQLEALYAH